MPTKKYKNYGEVDFEKYKSEEKEKRDEKIMEDIENEPKY